MPTPRLSEAKIAATAAAYNAAGGDMHKAAMAVSVGYNTFKSRVQFLRQTQPDIFTEFVQPKKARDRTLDEDVELHRAKESDTFSKAKLRDSLKVIAALQNKIADLEWGAKASLKPAEWARPERKAGKREHIPYLLTSDFQIGEVILANETEAGYGYDSRIFSERYRQMIDMTIYLSLEHGGKDWTFPGIIYARGGDTISGGIHEELRETDDLTPIEAVELAFEEEAAGILKLADAFGRVEVKTPGSAGNHDRNLPKPTTKKASAHSYDRLIAFMLRKTFNTDKRVHFQTSDSFDVRFPIYKQNIILTHGDRMGSSGGQGFVGPMATIMRGAQKVIMEQAALGFHIDRVDHGHFHTPGYMGWVLSNGCLPGYSEYAKSYRMRPSPPTQMLAFHHEKHGLVDLKPLILL